MPSYFDWNNAILGFITQGLQLGSRVFLSIDEAALIGMGAFLDSPPLIDDRVTDFIDSVRSICVTSNTVNLSRISPTQAKEAEAPPYLGFLAATVFAAYQMAEDEDISQINYFIRLNAVLGFPEGTRGRPPGLDTGREESLWLNWANWLIHQGYLPSTPKEETGPFRYINYPISQTLLRASDKVSLWEHFSDRKWPRNLDENSVSARVIKDKQWLTRHVRGLLDETSDPSRREGLLDAISEIYDHWISSDVYTPYSQELTYSGHQNIMAGLYRQVDVFTNTSHYYLLPQQPRHTRLSELRVTYNENEYLLIQDRPGWYGPQWMLSSRELEEGVRAQINGADEIQQLVLPARDFWILAPDPIDPSSGLYGSWSRPGLGTPFIILCKSYLQEQLTLLKQRALIDWRSEPSTTIWHDGIWMEFQDVLVLSQDWHGVSIQNEDLLRSLQPNTSLGISLRGGLKAPESGGWLAGYGPQLTVFSFYKEATAEVFEPITNLMVVDKQSVKTNEPIQIEWPNKAGNYLLVIRSGRNMNEVREVTLKVVDWSELTAAALPPEAQIRIGSSTISGAVVNAKDQS